MDNKVTKERFNNHLEYEWFLYVIILIVSIVLFIFVFNQINSNRDYEQIDIFISCHSQKETDFAQESLLHLKENKDDLVREINLNFQQVNGEYYSTLFSTHGAVTSDIVIVGKNYMQNTVGFVEWTDELINRVVPESMRDSAEYYDYEYERNGTKYTKRLGIRIDTLTKIDTLAVFEPYLDEGEQLDPEDYREDTVFYLTINPESANIYGFNAKSKPEHTHALELVTFFLETFR